MIAAFGIMRFCTKEVSPLGFIQKKVVLSVLVVAVNLSVSFAHGVLAEAVTVIVLSLLVILAVSEEKHLFVSVTVMVYGPAVSPVKELLFCGALLLRV